MNITVLLTYYESRTEYDNILIYNVHRNLILENKNKFVNTYLDNVHTNETNLWTYFLKHKQITNEDRSICFSTLLENLKNMTTTAKKIKILEKLITLSRSEFESPLIWEIMTVKQIETHFLGDLITDMKDSEYVQLLNFISKLYFASYQLAKQVDNWLDKVIKLNQYFSSIDLNNTMRSDYSRTKFLKNLFLLFSPFFKNIKYSKLITTRWIPLMEISVLSFIRYHKLCVKYLDTFKQSMNSYSSPEILDIFVYKSMEIDYIYVSRIICG